ncbi:MAG: hypothetical protein JNM68_04995, partial [Dinghuibacter sp.]|nr:hypothetical protein [Dinghuibacter sp.]
MKTRLIVLMGLLVSVISPVFAQKKTYLPKKESENRGPNISFGVGVSVPGTAVSDSAYIRQMNTINANFYKPVIKRNKYSVGFVAGANYGWGNQKQITKFPVIYPVFNSNTNNFQLLDNGNPKSRLLQLDAGLAASISLGRNFDMMPELTTGYIHIEQKGISASQSNSAVDSGDVYLYSFAQKEQTTKGAVFTPRIKFVYKTGNIGIWASAGYTIGPDIVNESTRSLFISSPNVYYQGSYQVQTRTQYRAANIGLGITSWFGRHTCLICGGKHRGKCKHGYVKSNIGSGETDVQNTRLNRYGSCPHCHHLFVDNDEIYHHSCLKVKSDKEFYDYSNWTKINWNGSINDLFNLPQVFTAIPASGSIETLLKNIFKDRLIEVIKTGNDIKVVYKQDSADRTDILFPDPNPPILAHIMGVKITCIGPCANRCVETGPGGSYKCIGCTGPNSRDVVCKQIIEGD